MCEKVRIERMNTAGIQVRRKTMAGGVVYEVGSVGCVVSRFIVLYD